jgi:hypothetical protein
VWNLATIQAKAEAGTGAAALAEPLASTPELGADMLRHASGAKATIAPMPARARHHMLRHPMGAEPMGAEQRDAEPIGTGTTDLTPMPEYSDTSWRQLMDMMAEMSGPQRTMHSVTGGLETAHAAHIDGQIHQLINAMATFAPPAAGQTSLAGKPEPVMLQGDLAAGWR